MKQRDHSGLTDMKVRWSTRSDITPLRYPGGKRKLAPFIADLMLKAGVRPALFAEPFAGGAAVSISLLEAGHVDEIALNDLDPMVSSFWQTVFSSEAVMLAEMVRGCEASLKEWDRIKTSRPTDTTDLAFKCLYLNRTSFSGSLSKLAGPMGGRAQTSENTIGSRFNKDKIADRILELAQLRDRVRYIANESYSTFLSRASMSERTTVCYLDPPFFAKAERLYGHYFDQQGHETLAAVIDDLTCRWILSYDDHIEAERLYGSHAGFSKISLQYTARIDAARRSHGEVVVSDMIGELRRCGTMSTDAAMTVPVRSRHSQHRLMA